MKVQDVLDQIAIDKPNALVDEDLIRYIDDLEAILHIEVLKKTEIYVNITVADTERELLAPNPYHRIYVEYLIAMIDKLNEDYESYGFTSEVFNATVKSLKTFLIRGKASGGLRFTNYF